MTSFSNRLGAVVAAMIVAAASGPAWGGAKTYDLSILLDQPHPLALQAYPRSAGVTPIPPGRIHAPARVPPLRVAPRPAARRMAPPRIAQGVLSSGDGSIGGRRWLGGILSEIRLGVLIHDEGPFSRNEESGTDVNLELLFVPPGYLRRIGSPRPHFGVTLNSSGDTSQAYLGLSWEWDFWRNGFVGFSLGGAIHTGHLKSDAIVRKELGCRLLFRESVELGYRFKQKHAVSVYLDHLSNAGICDQNEGLENFGLRYGYRF